MPTATNNLTYEDNFFSTTLNGAISASDTTINLNAVPAADEGFLVIEPDSSTAREIIYYTSKGGGSVTCPSVAEGRGVGGTTAQSHSTGVTVQVNNVAELWEALQDGSANTGMHQYFDDAFSDFVKSGMVISQATGLIASVSAGVIYLSGRRLTTNPFSKTFTGSRETYVDMIETDGSNIATVAYTELASGVTGSTPASNGIHIGRVDSTASAIATIRQSGADILNNPLKLNQPDPRGTCMQRVDLLTTAVATGTTLIPLDDTIPQNTEGDQYMTLTITPRMADSILEIEANVLLSNSAANGELIVALFKDSGADALAVSSVFYGTTTQRATIHLTHSILSGTTSPITFKIRCGCSTAGTTTFNGFSGGRIFGTATKSSLVIREYTN